MQTKVACNYVLYNAAHHYIALKCPLTSLQINIWKKKKISSPDNQLHIFIILSEDHKN